MIETRIAFFTLVSTLLFVACHSSTDKGNIPANNSNAKNPYPENIQQLFSILQKYPDSTDLRLKLATALDSINLYKPALLQMDTLLQKDSANIRLWYTKGRIAEDAGDTLQALNSYDRAVRIYPSADPMLAIANLYAEKKNVVSLAICNQVKQMSLGREYDAHCDFISGIYNARTHNSKKAIEFFDACIANNYTYMPAYIEKGLVYFDDNQYDQALKIFNFASTINTLDSNPYYWQGRCYEKMNIRDSAILRFKQSLQLEDDPETRMALKRLGAE